jgi:hypothetical protein
MDKNFDMTKYFDEYSRNARTALSWIYPTEFRAILEKAVDLQIDAGKLVAKTATEAFSKMAPASK